MGPGVQLQLQWSSIHKLQAARVSEAPLISPLPRGVASRAVLQTLCAVVLVHLWFQTTSYSSGYGAFEVNFAR